MVSDLNVVLVHGAWADGSCWSGVIPMLQEAGCNVTAVQLPLTSLEDDVATTNRVLNMQKGPTILVAHSYGGVVVTMAGNSNPNVKGLVYISAFAPDKGETTKGLTSAEPQPAGAEAFRPDDYGFVWLDRDGFVKFFASDVERKQARILASVQKPVAASNFLSEEPLGEPAWKSLPSWYLVAEQDQIIPPDAQRLMAQRMGANISSIAASHVAMISHPKEVAQLIMDAVKTINL
jgi:pimeloyl-ACP methyl ester carboxylesterase